MNNSNLYSDIYVNRALKTAGLTGKQRPDIIGILRSPTGGKIAHAWEVAGKTQMAGAGLEALELKISVMEAANLSVKFNPIIFVTYPK